VPIIEVIDDPDNDSGILYGHAFVAQRKSPEFQYVKEIIDFVDQVLEVGIAVPGSMGV
jgi:hypothetical protein